MTNDSKFLIDVVKQAEKISREAFDVQRKGGESDLVTNLDFKIEEFLISKFKQAYPDFDIVSEEENFDKVPTENCFIIDPIDGTINFANNVPLWAIQVAMKRNGKTTAAVIDLPRINELYYADETGAYLNDTKIHVRQVPINNTIYAIDGGNNLVAMRKMRKYSPNRRNFGGVSVSMAFVAAGRIHGAVYRSNKPWDYEPGLYLVEKAGGATMNMSGFHAAAMDEEFLNILKMETSKNMDNSNVFVFHSLNGDTLQTWGQDVKTYLTDKEIDCYLPEFPVRAESSFEKFDEILSTYLESGALNKNSIVIGNPYFIRFCTKHNFVPKHYIAVAPSAIYNYPVLRNDYIVDVIAKANLHDEEFAFAKNLKSVFCITSDEGSNVVEDEKQERFSRFVKDFHAKDIHLDGYFHFDGYHRIYKIPELIELLSELL